MPGRVGRPKHAADEVCSHEGCNNPGHRYIDTVKKDGDVYYYYKFRHADPTIRDHVIQGWDPPELDLIEYKRFKREATVFGRKGAHTIKSCPVVIFHLNKSDERIADFVGRCYRCYGRCTDIHDIRCDVCNRTTIHWCPDFSLHLDFSGKISSVKITCPDRQTVIDELEKLKIPILKLEDVIWFLKPKRTKRTALRANHFLSNLLNMLEESDHLIITYGDNSLKESERISKLFDCGTTGLMDQFGILKQFERRIRMRKIQKESYNKPQPTFPNPNLTAAI
jgi:hypothetical protein